jgi:glycosyltransferase involved in cell wall biosynthesis
MSRPGGPPTVCFVTYELAPMNPGGCGSFITRIIPHLAGRCRVVVLAAMPAAEVSEYRRRGLHDPAGTGDNEVLCLDELVPEGALPVANVFPRNTQRFADALEMLARTRPIDLIEIPEYSSLAYATLKLRRQRGRLAAQRLVIRAHGSLELIDHHEAYGDHGLERRLVYTMERYVLRHAETLLMATPATHAYYNRFYEMDRPALVSPPPPDPAPPPAPARRPEAEDGVLFVGKLQAVKGADLFVRAAVRWLEAGAPPAVRFRLVGSDTQPAGRSYRAFLETLVPESLRARFEFLGHLPPAEVVALARRARVAVVPSRFESYCYVAREMLALGVPTVLASIPAFEELRAATGVAFFDGSVPDLAGVVARHWDASPGLTAALAPAPAPAYGDFYAALAARPAPAASAPPAAARVDLFLLEAAAPRGGTGRVDVRRPGDATPLHEALRAWLGGAAAPHLAVALAAWDGDADALAAAADFLAGHPEVAAVELAPRAIVPWALADPDAQLLLLAEGDAVARSLFGLVPAALVFRRPARPLDVVPATPRGLVAQLVNALATDGTIELAWPPASTRGLALAPADRVTLPATRETLAPAERWAVGYLETRAAEQARIVTDLARPTYWIRRSLQILRNGGARAYLRKILEKARGREATP